jgi:glutaredoxin 3
MANIKKITVFTTPTCAYCPMVKEWLSSKKLDFEMVDLLEKPERQAEMMQKSGSMAVPVTLVQKEDGSERVVIGFNPGQLASATA